MELLASAQAGDAAALNELLARYEDRLRRIVRIQLGPSLRRHYESLDIVQSAFQAALPKLGEFQPRDPSSLLQWLARIAVNKIRDAADHHAAEKRDPAREVALDGVEASERRLLEPQARDTLPEDRVANAELREIVDEAVAGLPSDQQRVVLLRDYCGASWEQVVTDLGKPNVHAGG